MKMIIVDLKKKKKRFQIQFKITLFPERANTPLTVSCLTSKKKFGRRHLMKVASASEKTKDNLSEKMSKIYCKASLSLKI